MQAYSTAYLHLMRAFARTGRAETFAFSTSLTRLTPVLVHRSAGTALALAEERVVDRFGGTHLAATLQTCSRSRHGSTLRGGVLVIASDGWDSDEPEELARGDGAAAAAGAPGGLAEPAGRGARVRAAGGLDGGGAAVLRRLPAGAHVGRAPGGRRRRSAPEGDVHRRLEPAHARRPPRSIAWVARGVLTNRTSSAAAGGAAGRR